MEYNRFAVYGEWHADPLPTPKALHPDAQGCGARSTAPVRDNPPTPKALHPEAQGRAAHPGSTDHDKRNTLKGFDK